MDNITVVSIEGNIGSGKSTLLENLRKYYEDTHTVVFLKEPVDDWAKIQDEHGITILEKFYHDQEKYSFPFQMMAYVSRLKVLRDALKEIKSRHMSNENEKVVIITERSLYTDKMVFAKMLFDSGKIEYVNYQIYLSWFDTFAEEFPVHKVVYVKTMPEKCHSRILRRSRDGESNIPFEYLFNCALYHDKMLDKSSNDCYCADQLILDGNIDIYQNKNQLDDWIQEIDSFIRK
jgi:deoxyadenosine/deoxycytidine kinase